MGTDSSTQGVLSHHLQAFGEGNLDAVMSDYGDDSVLFTPDAVLQGPVEIKPLFEAFFAEFAKPGMSFNMDTQVVRGEWPTLSGGRRRPTTITNWRRIRSSFVAERSPIKRSQRRSRQRAE